jgi:hypothetical protein
MKTGKNTMRTLLSAVMFLYLIISCEPPPDPYENKFKIYTVNIHNVSIPGPEIVLMTDENMIARDTVNYEGFAAFSEDIQQISQEIKVEITDIDGYENNGKFQTMTYKLTKDQKEYTYMLIEEPEENQ